VVERLDDADKEMVLPLVEEALRVGKRRVETGRVRISVGTEQEDRVVRETLRSERAAVERVAIDRELTEGEAAPIVRRDVDGTLVVPILEEILVIERRLVLREELRLRVSSTEETVEETVTLRRQRAVVDHLPPAPPNGASQPNGPSSSDGTSTGTTSSET